MRQGPPINGAETVTADFSGVATLEQRYDVRLMVRTANGVNRGQNQIVVVHGVAGLHTDPAAPVGREGATLNASFIGTNEDTKFSFQWGTSPESLGAVTPQEDAGKTTGPTPISTPLTGLTPGTHLLLPRHRDEHPRRKHRQHLSFTTVPAVLGVKTEPATNVGKEAADLNGSFTGDDNATGYYFEYG